MSALQIQRGHVITVASPGAYSGKPRPAVVVQANRWLRGHPSITLCPLTSTLIEAPLVRIIVEPSAMNGLRKRSQLMVDKLFTVRSNRRHRQLDWLPGGNRDGGA